MIALFKDAPDTVLKQISSKLSVSGIWRKNHRHELSPATLRDSEYMTTLLRDASTSARKKIQKKLMPFMPYLIKDRTAQSALMRLPRELRNSIIGFDVEDRPKILAREGSDYMKKHSMPLLRVCKQLYYETAEALYGARPVFVRGIDNFDTNAQHKQFIRRVLLQDFSKVLPERADARSLAARWEEKEGFKPGTVFCHFKGSQEMEEDRWVNAMGKTIVLISTPSKEWDYS